MSSGNRAERFPSYIFLVSSSPNFSITPGTLWVGENYVKRNYELRNIREFCFFP